MNAIISKNIDHIKAICIDYNVEELFVFGSVVTNQFNDESDIDLLIKFKPMEPADYADNYFEIADRFEEIFQRPIDLVTVKSLKNPFLIDSIDKTKAQLYG